MSLSLPYATACKSLSDNVTLSFTHLLNSTNKLRPMVSGILCGKFVHKIIHISSKSFVPYLIFSVLSKSSHHLAYNFVVSLEPVPVNVRF